MFDIRPVRCKVSCLKLWGGDFEQAKALGGNTCRGARRGSLSYLSAEQGRACCKDAASNYRSLGDKVLLTPPKQLLLLFFCLGLATSMPAQRVDLSEDFTALASDMAVDFMAPLDAGYKDVRAFPNPHQNYELAIRSRKEKLEIRYHLEPEREGNPMTRIPHVRCMQMIANIASNEEDTRVSALSLPDSISLDLLNADWAKVFFFTPKKTFSHRLTCQMLAMYKEGKGMVFAYLLFNKPPLELDSRLLTVRFEEEEEQDDL
ncbi:MAG: hypothetical protein KTR30_36740 [Saprospiraceae bacterium]|nr:hypothetical protein [Saprospiraceae bacterium]